jgi:putative metalloprotease
MKATRPSAPKILLFTALFLAWSGISRAEISGKTARDAWKDVCDVARITALPLLIVSDDVPNAWTAFGKSVTITTGLLNLLDGDAEVFGVLSHEAGHIVLGHHEAAMSNAVATGTAAAVLKGALGDDAAGKAAIDAGVMAIIADFSVEQEFEADDYAVDLAFKAGRDPRGLYRVLERIALLNGISAQSIFNSHPADERRLRHIKERILAAASAIALGERQPK